MDDSYHLLYEKRYQKVYEAGADYWGHTPDDEELTEHLTEWVNRHGLKGKRIIEFFCGEGAAGVILSKLGCIYHGVDIAPSAVQKAKESLKSYPNATVTQLNVVTGKIDCLYDAALDVMGFHMLVADPDRLGYLSNAFSCLKNKAPMFFFREMYAEDADDNFINSFEEWQALVNFDPSTPRNLHFQKDGKDIEIQIPYVAGRSKTKAGYTTELSQAGFIVDSIMETCQSNKVGGDSVSIHAHKP